MRNLTRARAVPVALAVTVLSIGHATSVRAADTPPANTFRIGMYAIFYHVTAENIQGPFIPPGVNLNVNLKDTQTAYFAYIRRLSSVLDLELAFGVPPQTSTIGRGPDKVGSVPYNGVEIATAKWLAPSALLEYRFLKEDSAFQPYIGVGINYTSFYDRKVTPGGEQVIGGPTRLSLTSSVGPVGTVGLKYQPHTRWSVFMSYSISSVDSDLKADTAGAIHTTRVHFGPQAFVFGAGYSF
jgi:outer membrane protein